MQRFVSQHFSLGISHLLVELYLLLEEDLVGGLDVLHPLLVEGVHLEEVEREVMEEVEMEVMEEVVWSGWIVPRCNTHQPWIRSLGLFCVTSQQSPC